MADYKIRQMVPDDVAEVLKIQTLCNLSDWGKDGFEKELSNQWARLYVAFNDGKIQGFISARLITPGVEVLNIAVLPELRKQGIGKKLLQTVFEQAVWDEASESWLEVRESNLTAQNFYSRQGYKIVGRRKNYYSNPSEDGLLMTFIFSDKNPKK